MQKITTTVKKTIAYLAKNLPVWKRTPHVLVYARFNYIIAALSPFFSAKRKRGIL